MRFEVLGPIRVRAGGTDGVPVRGRRERVLLAMLLLGDSRPVTADRLIEAIWGAAPPATARNQVQVAVFRLRNRFADAGIPGPTLVTDQDGYRAQIRPDQLDLADFRAEVSAARRAEASGDSIRARDHYRSALACWRGPAFADVDSPPVRQVAAALDDERLLAQEECVRLDLLLGAGGELVAELTELVAAQPYRERLHAALMRALYRAGRQADALAVFRRVRALLHSELGTEPGTELQELHRAILNGDPTLAEAGAPPSSADDDANEPVAAHPLVRLLGPVELWVDGGRIALGTPRQRCVLALLAMTPGQPVALAVLADRVWGDDGPRHVRETLYAHVSRLRGPVRRVGGALSRRDGGYVLELEPGRVDVHRARRLAAEARAATGTPDGDDRAARLLREASELWRGTPLAGLPGDWAARVRSGLDQERLAILTEWFEVELRRGAHASVIVPLSAAYAEYPLAEPLAGQLMLALYRCGRQADALDTYARLRQRLVDEIGDEPAGRLRELHGRILRRDPELDLTAAGASTTVAAARPAADVLPAQLPPDIVAFTGRAGTLTELDSLLGDHSDTGLHTVVISTVGGAAGIGKTALAVHWSHRVASQFPDGQLYRNLRGFDPGGSPVTPADAVRSFLDALGVPPARIPASLDAQVGLYRSLLTGRRMLILLDNARDAAQVQPLLPSTPGCLVIVTSRNRLSSLIAAAGARPLTLDLFTAEEARQLLAQRLGPDRVAAEPAATDEIITRCTGLPLALAIVAARASTHPHFSLCEVAKELAVGDGLEPWSDPDAAADLRVVLSWSYGALTDDAARLFRLLGLHPGPDLSVPAAAGLAAATVRQARRWLAELAHTHLITESVPGRYTCHDLIRSYATELVHTMDAEPDRLAAIERMLDGYLDTAHRAAMLLNPHRPPITVGPPRPGAAPEDLDDQANALAWFAREHPVLRAAIARAAAIRSDAHAWQLAWSLADYHQRQGCWHDWETAQTTALAAARRLGDLFAQAVSHRSLAGAFAFQHRYDDAYTHARYACDRFSQLGDQDGLARTHVSVASVLSQQGRYQDALTHAQHGLALHRKQDDRAGQAHALNGIGWLHAQLDDHRGALDHCRQALALQQEIGDRPAEGATWDSLGYSHHQLGEHDQAARCYQRSLDLVRAYGNRYQEATVLTQLGDTRHAAGDPDAARVAWLAALAILEGLDDPGADRVRAKLHQRPPP